MGPYRNKRLVNEGDMGDRGEKGNKQTNKQTYGIRLPIWETYFAFQLYTCHWIFCKAGIKIMQNCTVFLFTVYSQWDKFCPKIWNEAFAIGQNTPSHTVAQDLTHSTRMHFADLLFHNSIRVPWLLVTFSKKKLKQCRTRREIHNPKCMRGTSSD